MIRELLCSLPFARDLLPYTDDFHRLKEEFYSRSFRRMTDGDFWHACVNVAKKGGIHGKPRNPQSAPLTDAQKEMVRQVLPFPIGERDKLPYSELFTKMVGRFNAVSGLQLGEREVWLALLAMAK